MKDIKISFKMDMDFIAFIIVGGFLACKMIENYGTFKYYTLNQRQGPNYNMASGTKNRLYKSFKNDMPKEDEKGDK